MSYKVLRISAGIHKPLFRKVFLPNRNFTISWPSLFSTLFSFRSDYTILRKFSFPFAAIVRLLVSARSFFGFRYSLRVAFDFTPDSRFCGFRSISLPWPLSVISAFRPCGFRPEQGIYKTPYNNRFLWGSTVFPRRHPYAMLKTSESGSAVSAFTRPRHFPLLLKSTPPSFRFPCPSTSLSVEINRGKISSPIISCKTTRVSRIGK